jgi:hypothetical protein
MKPMRRLALFMPFGIILLVAPLARTQIKALDSMRVSLEVRDLALREALQQLVSQTNAQLVYHDAIVAGVKTSCSLKNVSLRQALEEILLPADLAYRMMDDGQIVIVWRGWRESPPEPSGHPRGPGFHRPPPERPEFIASALQDLDLSEMQKARVDSLQKTQHEKVIALFRQRQSGELNFEDFRLAHRKLADDMMKQMQNILTKEQYKQFKKTLEQPLSPRGSFPPFGPEGGPIHQPPPRRR